MLRAVALLLLVVAACAGPGTYSPRATARPDAGAPRPFGFTSFGRSTFVDRDGDGLPDARLDDVTNGLQDKPAGRSAPAKAAAEETGAAPPAGERMLVQRGEIELEVARPEDSGARFLARVQELGGYLSQQQDRVLTVRVPAAKFDALFAELHTYGRVLAESRTAEDVTEEFVDLGIRLDNARKARDRLLELLQKADKVEDILKIEEQLRRLSEEIERMEGRRKFLADQTAMARLSVAFRAAGDAQAPQPRASRFPWINAVGAERVQADF